MSATRFADRLKQLREAAGLTQPELADRASMNRFGVAKLEQGVREPSWATVQALARALGVSVLAFADEESQEGLPQSVPPGSSTEPASHAFAASAPRQKRA